MIFAQEAWRSCQRDRLTADKNNVLHYELRKQISFGDQSESVPKLFSFVAIKQYFTSLFKLSVYGLFKSYGYSLSFEIFQNDRKRLLNVISDILHAFANCCFFSDVLCFNNAYDLSSSHYCGLRNRDLSFLIQNPPLKLQYCVSDNVTNVAYSSHVSTSQRLFPNLFFF